MMCATVYCILHWFQRLRFVYPYFPVPIDVLVFAFGFRFQPLTFQSDLSFSPWLALLRPQMLYAWRNSFLSWFLRLAFIVPFD
jgi:hypothetical protein